MYFPFEKYTASSDENEYKEDLRKKNSILKFMNSLDASPTDRDTLLKLVNIFIYFRNIFCKEAFLYFFLNKFEEKERKLVSRIVFDIFIASNNGEVGDWKQYYCLCEELLKDLEEEDNIDILSNWDSLKGEFDVDINKRK